ncbi:MAG: hypothetical protein WBF67_13165, partial [Olleya sp.]
LPIIPYRYISKTLVLGSLLVFTGYNFFKKGNLKSNFLFYGLSQYLIILGVLNETIEKGNINMVDI